MSNKILLIGNGSNVANFNEEDYDTIVRFNWGIKDKGRTDAWVDALLQHENKLMFHYDRAGRPEIWRLNGESRHRLSQMPSEWYPSTTFISERNYNRMKNEFNSMWKPSIGFVCIWWLINVQNERDITITGFDSGVSKNRYTDEMPYTSHDWEKERLWIESLISDGSIKRL
jgi:hypothetical protein